MSNPAWRIPITEEQLRFLQETPGAMERVELEVNREIARMYQCHGDVHFDGCDCPGQDYRMDASEAVDMATNHLLGSERE